MKRTPENSEASNVCDSPDCGCGSTGSSMDRRDFLRLSALAATGLSMQGGSVMADTFEYSQMPAKMRRIEKLMASEQLLERGEPTIYSGERLEAISMPLGGIGAGCIQINGKAERHIWQIFNNFPPVELPHSFFAVRAKTKGGEPVVKSMQTSAVGSFAAMKSLSFRGEYPIGLFEFMDPDLPVAASMETFSPIIPLRAQDSARPCAIFNLIARNSSEEPVEVSFLAAQQNAVGYTGNESFKGRTFKDYGGNRNTIARENGTVILHMTSDSKDRPGHGEMALAVFDESASADASWENLDSLLMDFSYDGALSGKKSAGPSPKGETIDGALAVPFTLKPGESRTVTFVLVWYFPGKVVAVDKWMPNGNMYTNWWKDALAVVHDVREHYDELAKYTRLYRDTLYSSNLPYWMLDRISSQVAVLASKTCFWNQDGYFGGWEGCRIGGGCCPGNCSHVWHYAQSHARLFPSIGRRMREQAFAYQAPDGGIPFRQPSGKVAFDGQCGDILGAYREHLCSPNGDWLGQHWPSIRKAINYIIERWDKGESGVSKGQQHNTLDAELSGSTSWLGSLYLAALAASEKMAGLQGDNAAAERYRRIRVAGAKKQDASLFNGEYYIQVPDQSEGEIQGENYLTGCHIDQVLGQWWAHQLDLGWLYPEEHVRSAVNALFRYNFRSDFDEVPTYTSGAPAKGFPRKFVHNYDYAMIMTTWPQGGRPPKGKVLRFSEEVMSGFEYSAAAALVYSGLLEEGMLVLRSVSDRYNGRLRENLSDRAWGYSGNPFGDDECGKFYSRAMSIWSLLLASQGFIYDGPAAKMGFKPLWKPDDHLSFFTGAEGWGSFSQKLDSRKQIETLELHYGVLKLNQFDFYLKRGETITSLAVNGATHSDFNYDPESGKVSVILDSVEIQGGQTLQFSADLS